MLNLTTLHVRSVFANHYTLDENSECPWTISFLYFLSCFYLKDDKDQEVEVSQPLELLKQIFGEEGDDVVFGSSDVIIL